MSCNKRLTWKARSGLLRAFLHLDFGKYPMSETVQLMLIADCAAETIGPLSEALERFDIACVLIVPAGWQPGTMNADDLEMGDAPTIDADRCRPLVELIQGHNAAAIVANDAAAAKTAGADGCHLDHSEALEEIYRNARGVLGAGAIVGVMPGATRHMAMTLAQAGIDYVGYPVTGAADDPGLEYVAWWAEIFESPVVAFAAGDVAVCRRAIEAGPPDFLAVPLLIDAGIGHLQAIARLIEESGQLPVAARDAK